MLPWQALADGLLQREALLFRLGDGVPPRDLAGMFVTGEDVDRILGSLPGLDGAPPEMAESLRRDLDQQLAELRGTFAESLADDSLFSTLVRTARLSYAEAEVLALVAAVELHPQRSRLVGYLQDSVQLPRVTLATLDRIFAGTEGGSLCLAPDAALRRAEIVGIESQGPWAVRMTSLPSRVAWYLRGDSSPDPELPADARMIDGDLWSAAAPTMINFLAVHGADRETRLAQVKAHWPGAGVIITSPPGSGSGWAAVVREATVSAKVVVIETDTALDGVGRLQIERTPHLAWALSSAGEIALETLPRRPWREIGLTDGTATDTDWQQALGHPIENGFRLSREQLRLVASTVRTAGEEVTVTEGVRRLAGGHLDRLALRVSPRRGWDDLVLPRDQFDQLSELAGRYRRRQLVYESWGFPAWPSSGVVALFSGSSGTGKTLAAEVIAGDLDLDLYKVDLSSVVSKYIGETEKNLSRIFEAAGAADLVLFFDEADALFGKRTEVGDSRDRYANLEVSYLLQRLERYNGIVIMATNLQRNIDQAFIRRISVTVDFPQPEEGERRAIWQRSFPDSAPQQDLDLDFLAKNFKITGGVIHNAALGAAFLAADAAQVITMEHVALALKREFQKLGRLRTETEFAHYFELVSGD